MKTILFYWSKGAETRRKIVLLIYRCEKEKAPCYINTLARKLRLSHVAIKKHISLLMEEGYVSILNPNSKPQFLVLTAKGREVAKELLQDE